MLTLIVTLVLVTLGAFTVGHALVLWARRRGTLGHLTPSFAIGFGTAALGLTLDATGTWAAVALTAALAVLVVALLALVRRKAGPAL